MATKPPTSHKCRNRDHISWQAIYLDLLYLDVMGFCWVLLGMHPRNRKWFMAQPVNLMIEISTMCY